MNAVMALRLGLFPARRASYPELQHSVALEKPPGSALLCLYITS